MFTKYPTCLTGPDAEVELPGSTGDELVSTIEGSGGITTRFLPSRVQTGATPWPTGPLGRPLAWSSDPASLNGPCRGADPVDEHACPVRPVAVRSRSNCRSASSKRVSSGVPRQYFLSPASHDGTPRSRRLWPSHFSPQPGR